MSESYDAVIIGGGIIGAALAYHLAKKNYGKIAVVEKDQYIGNGSTAKCAGGIRAQFSSEINVRMSLLSENKFETFSQEMDAEAQFDQVGYLFVLTNEEQVVSFKSQFEMWKRLGVPAQWMSRDDIKKMVPVLNVEDILGGTLSMKDGIGDPHQFTQGYVAAARKLGVKFLLETEATGVTTSGDKLTAVKTTKGELATNTIVNAAGPYAGLIAKFIGNDLPVVPIKRQLVTTAPLDFITDAFPMVVDIGSGVYTHKESGGLLLGWADKSTPVGFDESVDPEYTDNILMRGLDRIPALETAEIKAVWGGLYESTPDHHAVIGPSETHPRFFQCTGFSGHGFMHAPAAAIVTAELMCGEKTSFDISALSPSRFVGAVLGHEGNVI